MITIAALVMLARVVATVVSPLNLHFDEAQYWTWSRELAWGYFSKPPLIAWAIAATTALFGNAEWAVRLAAPLGHGLASLALFLLARRLHGPTAGLWAGGLWLSLPAVGLSSAVISTDALLLPIWAAALFALFRLVDRPGWGWAIGLGALVGMGALSKYAMLYFLLCAALAALVSPRARAALASRYGLAAAGAALLVLAPNLAWNASHSFATIGHTAANANLQGNLFNPGEMADFIASQAGVIGPVLFGALIWLFWRAGRGWKDLSETERILIAFILPPLIAIIMQALISRAHANWAASAYPAAVVWMAGRLSVTSAGRRVLLGAAGVNGLIGAVLLSFFALPSLADSVGAGGAFKRVRGWDAVCHQTALRSADGDYSAVLVDHRALFFALSYYCRPKVNGAPLPALRMWLLREEAANHAAATAPMSAQFGRNVLVVHLSEGYVPVLLADFSSGRWLGADTISLGGGEYRWIGFSAVSSFEPVPRDGDFEARLLAGPPAASGGRAELVD